MIKNLSIVFEIFAFISGMVASFFWYKSTKIQIDPGPGVSSGDSYLNHMSWTVGTMKAFSETSRLNKTASLWTALTVFLSAVSAFLQFFFH